MFKALCCLWLIITFLLMLAMCGKPADAGTKQPIIMWPDVPEEGYCKTNRCAYAAAEKEVVNHG
jgi:hypothetical protein